MKFVPNSETIRDILFIDVKTVSQYPNLEDAPAPYQRFWARKAERFMGEGETPATIYSKSAIFSEFGRILAISMGFFRNLNGKETLRITTLTGDERAILIEFCRRVESFAARHENFNFCAHNGKEFDFPYIARRLLIQGFPIPPAMYAAGRKPWETNFLDTFELWKFGDYKHFTPLYLLGYIFGVSELIEDMEGSKIHEVYYLEANLEKIAEFSQHELATCAQLYRRFVGLPAIPHDDLEYNAPTLCADKDEDPTVIAALPSVVSTSPRAAQSSASFSTPSPEASPATDTEISSETPLEIPISFEPASSEDPQ